MSDPDLAHALAAERERVINAACDYLRPGWETDEQSDCYVTGGTTRGSRETRFRESIRAALADS